MNIDDAILESLDGTEWHMSLWFPRVAREVVGLRTPASDAEVQHRLIRLIDQGVLETGMVEGAEFIARKLESSLRGCPDLYIRLAGVCWLSLK